MTVDFDIEYHDFEAFQLYYVGNDKSFRRLRMAMFAFVPAILIVPALIKGADWHYILPSLLVSMAWIVVFSYVFNWSVRRSAKRMYNNPDNSRLFSRRSMEFGPDGIEVKTGSAQVRLEWYNIARVVDTVEYFFIFTGSQQGYIVPKRYVSDEQAQELRELFLANTRLISSEKIKN